MQTGQSKVEQEQIAKQEEIIHATDSSPEHVSHTFSYVCFEWHSIIKKIFFCNTGTDIMLGQRSTSK